MCLLEGLRQRPLRKGQVAAFIVNSDYSIWTKPRADKRGFTRVVLSARDYSWGCWELRVESWGWPLRKCRWGGAAPKHIRGSEEANFKPNLSFFTDNVTKRHQNGFKIGTRDKYATHLRKENFISNNIVIYTFFYARWFSNIFLYIHKLSHTPRILSLGSLCAGRKQAWKLVKIFVQ